MKRYIPLTKESEWACMRILEHNKDSLFAFPKYTSLKGCNANSASAALNKWLKVNCQNHLLFMDLDIALETDQLIRMNWQHHHLKIY